MRPTPLGLAAGTAAVALLAAAYLLGYPRLAVLGVGGLAALALAVTAVIRRPPVRMSREIFPDRVTRSEPAVGMLTVHNASRWAGVQLEVRESFGGTDLPVPVPVLRRGDRREIGYQLPTGRRGVIEVGPLRWERSDPLGLLRRQQSLAGTQHLYVHPVTHPFPLGTTRRSQRWDSATSDAAPEGTITFHTLREYVPGDDLRHIHWRSSARLDTLMVRRNIDVSLPRTTMLLITDRAAYPEPDRFEDAVEVAASTVLAAARERLPARLWTSEGMILNGSGGHDDARIFLDFLAEVELGDGAGLAPVADRLEHAEGGGVLVVATGALEPAGLGVLRRLAARYDDTVVALLGPGAGEDDREQHAAEAALSIVEAPDAARFCARWTELVQR